METEKINKGRKYQQVIVGARAIFLSEGFEAANMDVIAQTAKVSKATLYSYFPDKQSPFLALFFTPFFGTPCMYIVHFCHFRNIGSVSHFRLVSVIVTEQPTSTLKS